MKFFDRLSRRLAPLNIQFAGTHVLQPSTVLLPSEKAAVAKAVLRRIREYATGRWCARRALARLGIAKQPLASADRGAIGAPVWPAGVCGSITHTRNACCAVAARSRHYRSLGIDLERRAQPVSPGALALIANEEELAWLHFFKIPGWPGAIFLAAAKESAIKLMAPLVRKPLAFTALSLLPPLTPDGFEFVLNEDLGREFRRGRRFQGRWFSDARWVLALCGMKPGR